MRTVATPSAIISRVLAAAFEISMILPAMKRSSVVHAYRSLPTISRFSISTLLTEPKLAQADWVCAEGAHGGLASDPLKSVMALNRWFGASAGDASGAFPRITGQSAFYLAKQLRDFTSGVRSNAIMSPIAKALSPQDITDVAAYFAAASGPFPALANPDPALVKLGEELAKVGSAARGIQACGNCHGPGAVGEPPAIPYLAGQYASYIMHPTSRSNCECGSAVYA
jgi:cytochrome c553